jgi:putative flippase GtrA
MAKLGTAEGQGVARSALAFLVIGGGGALGYIVLTSLVLPSVDEANRWLVSALIYAAFVLPVYLLHRRFSFSSQTEHRKALPRYIAVQAMAVLLATVFSFAFHSTGVVPVWLASTFVAGLTAGVNFTVLKAWAFAQPASGGTKND